MMHPTVIDSILKACLLPFCLLALPFLWLGVVWERRKRGN